MKDKNIRDFGTEYDIKLRKSLNKFELLFLSLGSVIGSGWLFAPLYASSEAGVASIISWIIGGMLILFIALTYAEISGMLPKSGGVTRYPYYTHGGIIGFIMTWAYFITYAAGPAIETEAVLTYLTSIIPGLTIRGTLTLLGIILSYLFLVLFFLINYIGVNILGRITHYVGWLKLIIPIFTIILLIPVIHISNFISYGFFPLTRYSEANLPGPVAMLFAIPSTGIIFAYLGFRQAIEYGGEAKNPKKDLPFAVLGAVLIPIVIYFLLQLVFIGALNWNSVYYINSSGTPIFKLAPGNWSGLAHSSITSGPLFEEFKIASVAGVIITIFSMWTIILLIDAIVSPSVSAWINLGTATRTAYAFAANGLIPSIFLRIHEKTKIPIFSLILATVVGGIYLIPFPSWRSLVGIISASAVFTYLMGGIGLESFRKLVPNAERKYKLRFSKVIAPLATMSASLIVYWSSFPVLFYVVTAIFLGMPLFYGYYAYRIYKMPKVISAFIGLLNVIAISVASYLLYYNTDGLSSNDISWFIIYIIILVFLALLDVFSVLKFSKTDNNISVEIKASYWIFSFILFILIISYFGSLGVDPLIPFPYDTLFVAITSIGFHYWAVKSAYRSEALLDALNISR